MLIAQFIFINENSALTRRKIERKKWGLITAVKEFHLWFFGV